MAKYDVAHIREQGQDMVIIPVDAAFTRKSASDQDDIHNSLQYAASDAGLKGNVVLIWNTGRQVGFRAPRQWHPFFKSPGIWQLVMRNINRTLTIT